MNIYGYQRSSIFWALMLIAVGTIFLYHNFNPAIRPWEIIGKYWPILIIFWGASKLIGHLQARAHPETVVPPLFTGSEVVLLLLILLLGTLVSKIALRPWPQWPSALGIQAGDEDFADLFLDSFTSTQTLSQAVPPQPRLVIINRRGDVEIRASDKPTLDAVVKETIRAENEDAAKKLANQLKIEVVEEAGRFVLRTNLDSLPQDGRRVRLDLSLRAPKRTSAEITAEHGDIILDGLQGDETLTTQRGDAHVTNVEGLVRVHKSGESTEVRGVKGNVEVDGRGSDLEVADVAGTVTVNGDFGGAVQFRNVTQLLRYDSSRTNLSLQKLTGRLNMEVRSLDANGIDGPFEISTRQKDITLEEFRHVVKIINTNGDIELRTSVSPTHPIDVDLKKGAIELAMPTTSNFQIEASSRHGEVECDFSGPNLKVSKEGEAPSITGSYGKGGTAIHLSTAYGTIRLTRLGPRPAAPLPEPGEGEKKALDLPRVPQVASRMRSPLPSQPWLLVATTSHRAKELTLCFHTHSGFVW